MNFNPRDSHGSESARRNFRRWVHELSPQIRADLQAHRSQVVMRGYASRSGDEHSNRDLSQARIDTATAILLDELGPGVQVVTDPAALGEAATEGPDGVNDAEMQRVDVAIVHQ
jgi:hypothetical protein